MAKKGETWEDSWDRLWETRMGEMRKEWIRGMVAIAARKKAREEARTLRGNLLKRVERLENNG